MLAGLGNSICTLSSVWAFLVSSHHQRGMGTRHLDDTSLVGNNLESAESLSRKLLTLAAACAPITIGHLPSQRSEVVTGQWSLNFISVEFWKAIRWSHK
ncbi:hypothetical protein J3A83DRAFT_4246776 [Scleroderma citrinum]